MTYPNDEQHLGHVRERAAAFGEGTTFVEIPGMQERCLGAYLLSRGDARRVLVLDAWDKSLLNGAVEIAAGASQDRSWHLGEWHELEPKSFFARQIERTTATIESYRKHLEALKKIEASIGM
jgi:hypothetical protein